MEDLHSITLRRLKELNDNFVSLSQRIKEIAERHFNNPRDSQRCEVAIHLALEKAEKENERLLEVLSFSDLQRLERHLHNAYSENAQLKDCVADVLRVASGAECGATSDFERLQFVRAKCEILSLRDRGHLYILYDNPIITRIRDALARHCECQGSKVKSVGCESCQIIAQIDDLYKRKEEE